MGSQTKDKHDDTILTHAGRKPHKNKGVVNPPVYHASTILFPTLADLKRPKKFGDVGYARKGTPTTFAFQEAVAELEHGYATFATASGLAAVTTSILATCKAGGHLLLVDTVYGPTRSFMDKIMTRYGVETEYYDPLIGSGIKNLIRENTCAIFMETPGSWTFEVQDIPAIVAEAKKRDVITIVDNTWSAGYYFKPLDHGVDISVQAATKYIVGHSDAMMGVITCNEKTFPIINEMVFEQGMCAGPDDIYLAQRGLRTMGTRLRQHHENGLKVANWLQNRPEVQKVLHPALPTDPGHEICQRDFTGACGLFGFIMDKTSKDALANMLDNMAFFGMGFSWGGFESLLIPVHPSSIRTATDWTETGETMRIHIGLEDVDDLIADIEAGFERLKQG